jgi:hypothetical protein
MNSTPKQQDGDDGGVAPASGARSSLEQTVLGVAPAPNAPAPSAGSAEPPQPAMPPPLELTVSPPPPLTFAPPSPAAPATDAAATGVLIAAPVIVVAAPDAGTAPAGTPEPRGLPREAPSSPSAASPSSPAAASPSAVEPPSLPFAGPVTAPIPLVHVVVPVEAASPPHPVHRAGAAPDVTLPVGAAPMPPVEPVPQREAAAQGSVQRTALSDDYLREARQAALDAVARSSATPHPGSASPLGDTARSFSDLDAAPPSFGTRPSIVSTPLAREADPGGAHEAVAVKSSRGFEPVPVLRAPLSESLSGGLGPVAEVGGHRNGGMPSSARSRATLPAQRSGDAVLRWLLLAAVALISVATVMVGQRLWQRYREPVSPQLAAAVSPAELDGASRGAASTARALMPSRPAVEAAPPGRALVVSVTGGHAEDAPGPGGAGPEAQLAATAGRHVIAGNYSDALPLYQQLERAYPDNGAYVAMSRLLEKKVGASNDTRTVTPATPGKPVKK